MDTCEITLGSLETEGSNQEKETPRPGKSKCSGAPYHVTKNEISQQP
jgi:hypothetical protein